MALPFETNSTPSKLAASHAFVECIEVPNELWLRAESLPKRHLDKYPVARKEHYIWEAAARLWTEAGTPLQQALEIVKAAFDEVTVEE